MEIRDEIKNVIDELPQIVLDDLLIYLRKVKAASKDSTELSQNLRKILIEDVELLNRLSK